MTTILLALTFCIADWARGRGYVAKAITLPVCGLATALSASQLGYSLLEAGLLFLAVTSGLLFYLVWDTGKGFVAIHGQYLPIKEEGGFWPAQALADWTYDDLSKHSTRRLWGWTYATIRFWLPIMPMFIAIALIKGSYMPLSAAFGTVIIGTAYYLLGFKKSQKESDVQFAEAFRGLLIGALVGVAL